METTSDPVANFDPCYAVADRSDFAGAIGKGYHWQMMGALEALNGIILFGLTLAFLLTMIQQIWPLGSRLHGGHD